MKLTLKQVAIHEAGHVIATLAIGCLLYDAVIGTVKSRPRPYSAGHISRGTQTARQSAVIGIAGAMSEYLHDRREFSMTEFLDLFAASKYACDQENCRSYSLAEAASESRQILLGRWDHLERLISKLEQPQNHNRVIEAAELFQMAGCRLLDSRKLPVPKRKVQATLVRYNDRGYHQWLQL